MKATNSARFHTDTATGIITVKPETGVDPRQGVITVTRRPKTGTSQTGKPDTATKTRKPRRTRQAVTYPIGTGGNAQRPIPTGPARYSHGPVTGNPVHHLHYAKWRPFLERAIAAGLNPAKIALAYRHMTGKLGTVGVNRNLLTIRIDYLTESDWRQYHHHRHNPNKTTHNTKQKRTR